MPESDLPIGFQPSVFDRLIDADTAGTSDRRGYSEKRYTDAVRRDLQSLLDTRRPTFSQFGIEGLPEVQKSVVAYGLPDYANLSTLSDADRARITTEIAEAIRTFEPRLTDVEVTVKDTEQMKLALKNAFQLTAVYFHIEAKLRMDPCPPVIFETVLELSDGRHRVEGVDRSDD